jgi:hypothetical protein
MVLVIVLLTMTNNGLLVMKNNLQGIADAPAGEFTFVTTVCFYFTGTGILTVSSDQLDGSEKICPWVKKVS